MVAGTLGTSVARPLPDVASGVLHRCGVAVAIAFVFLLQSRIAEVLFPSLHISSFIYWSGVLITLLNGGVARAFSHRIGLVLLALTGWIVISVPFSIWIGGSLGTLKEWLKSMMAYMILAGVTAGWAQTRRLFHAMAYATFALSILALKCGVAPDGRLSLDRGRLGNPNLLGHALLVGLPFCMYVATNRRLSLVHRVLAILFMAPAVAAISRTGSRGALIAFGFILVIYWVHSSLADKLKLLSSAALISVTVVLLLPGTLMRRYTTLFEEKRASSDEWQPDSRQDAALQGKAVASTVGRMRLLEQSLRLTVRHPVFGVGPGQFPVAEDALARSEGLRRGMWQVTHNTLTEFSSEDGLPALFFFLVALCLCFKAVRIPKRASIRETPDWIETGNAAFYFSLSLIVWSIAALFSSFAHQIEFPALAGIAVLVHRTVQREMGCFRPVAPDHTRLMLTHSQVPTVRSPAIGYSCRSAAIRSTRSAPRDGR